MKKPFFLILVLMFSVIGCSLIENDEVKVVVEYGGEFYVSIVNTHESVSKVYFTWGEYSATWNEEKLVSVLGTLDELEVEGIKVLGPAYPDKGDLTVKIKEGNVVVAEDMVEKGTERVTVFYDF